jgi:hypothetical protein
MKIAIIDGLNQDMGLKILFPEADYFINRIQFDKTTCLQKYNIEMKTDWSIINDKNYDYLFIIISLYDTKKGTNFYKQEIYDILQKALIIINNNNFNKVFIFDNYDYDYDPNTILQNDKINLFFKRHYNKTKFYADNVIPFPFIMFGEKALIEKTDIDTNIKFCNDENKLNRVFWSGSLYCHTDNEYPCLRNRILTYTQIMSYSNNHIFNPERLPYETFIYEMNKSKISLDLLGVGCPNGRTFEILNTNSLLFREYSNLVWPFPEQFSEETIFKNATEYIDKINKLLQNNELYMKCLINQQHIVKKYFNITWIRNYIYKYMIL